MSDKQTINIDCAPGSIRPGDLLPSVLEGSGIPVKEPVSTFFGCWSWDYSEVEPEIWERHKAMRALRLTALYNSGRIRYADW